MRSVITGTGPAYTVTVLVAARLSRDSCLEFEIEVEVTGEADGFASRG